MTEPARPSGRPAGLPGGMSGLVVGGIILGIALTAFPGHVGVFLSSLLGADGEVVRERLIALFWVALAVRTVTGVVRSSAPSARLAEARNLAAQGHKDEALSIYDSLIRQLRPSRRLDRTILAQAMEGRGRVLFAVGNFQAALGAFNDVLANFGGANSVDRLVARSLVQGAVALHAMGRLDEAVAQYDGALGTYGQSDDLALSVLMIETAANLTSALLALARPHDAIVAADRTLALLERVGLWHRPRLVDIAVSTLDNRAKAMYRVGRRNEAIATYDEMLFRFFDAHDPKVGPSIAGALVGRSAMLAESGLHAAALAGYETVLRWRGDVNGEDAEMIEQVATAMAYRAATMASLGRLQESLTIRDEFLTGFAESISPRIRVLNALTLAGKARTLRLLGRGDDAMSTYRDLILRFGNDADPETQVQVAKSMVNTAIELREATQFEEALGVALAVAERFGEAKGTELRVEVARAAALLGQIELQRSRPAEAIVALEAYLARDDAFELELEETTATAMLLRADAIRALDGAAQALAAYKALVRQHWANADGTRSTVLVGRGRLARALAELNRIEEALAEYQDPPTELERRGQPRVRVRAGSDMSAVTIRESSDLAPILNLARSRPFLVIEATELAA